LHNRKNWLFCGSDSGRERAAAFYTPVRTARLNGIEPEAWLTDVIVRIAAIRSTGSKTCCPGTGRHRRSKASPPEPASVKRNEP
jgi:hypothetical protein